MPSVPPLVVPSHFRPNSLFVGMQKELEALDLLLFNPTKRNVGTTCVLLWCLAGGGKSHLARQYLYTQIKRFPGGVFWIRAQSQEELNKGFWQIARVLLQKEEEECELLLPGVVAPFVENVKLWFEKHDNWLLVFDGLSVDHEDDLNAVQTFIPDSKNSSIIITSLDRSLAKRQRLLYPTLLKVNPLSTEEAQAMLFKGLEMPNPNKQDRKSAAALVKQMDHLPLAIDAVAHTVRQSGEQLQKYLKTYSSNTRFGRLGPFVAIMNDLERLKHDEARNLINILCFFAQHIPVEMIRLGLKALLPFRVDVRSRFSRDSRSLDNSFIILMRYALIDRNDTDDQAHSKGIRDNDWDELKVHSVVQKFCLDSLRVARVLPRWLGYAVSLFCFSFDQANVRIKAKDSEGLASDYLEYAVHGKRLMEHITYHIRRHGELEDFRSDLESRLTEIKDQIEKRTPGSSQELTQSQRSDTDVPISIFDRTPSTSDTGPETPGFGGSTTVSTWGMDIGEAIAISPADMIGIGTDIENAMAKLPMDPQFTPHYTINGLEQPLTGMPTRPQLAPHYTFDELEGYASDMEKSIYMAPQESEFTVRPLSPATNDDDDDESFMTELELKPEPKISYIPKVHRTLSAQNKRKYQKRADAWRRIVPSMADPRVSPEVATGFLAARTSPLTMGNMTGSSDAQISLAANHKGSPPPPRGGSLRLITHSRSESRSRASERSPARHQYIESVISNHDVRMGDQSYDGGPVQNYKPLEASTPMLAALSNASSGSRGGRSQSRGRSIRSPSQTPREPLREPLYYANPFHYSDPNISSSKPTGPYKYNENGRPTFVKQPSPSEYAVVRGGNPNPIQFEEITVTGGDGGGGALKRHMPAEFRGHGSPNPAASSSMHNSPANNKAPVYSNMYQNYTHKPPYPLTGYSSQPISRDTSHNSALPPPLPLIFSSAADTEPARSPPLFSPPPSLHPWDQPGGPPPFVRDRLANGAPLRKSAKLSISHDVQSPSQSPIDHDDADLDPRHTLTAVGGQFPLHAMDREGSAPGIGSGGHIIPFRDFLDDADEPLFSQTLTSPPPVWADPRTAWPEAQRQQLLRGIEGSMSPRSEVGGVSPRVLERALEVVGGAGRPRGKSSPVGMGGWG
ncbi:MAG: hypothetical protein M1829_002023 [Trizodia sp. TS-e1964]|nr:MAG: hypothetical protein M1829_002023 [Trizodia sp. TS-e1964]